MTKSFKKQVAERWQTLRIELKVAFVSIIGVICAALIPTLIPSANNVIVREGSVNLLDISIGYHSYGQSNLAILDLKLENPGDHPVRITKVEFVVRNILNFVPIQRRDRKNFRVPVKQYYNVSLAGLSSGNVYELSLFHELGVQSSDRIAIVLGGKGREMADSPQTAGTTSSSYLAKIDVNLYSSDKKVATFGPRDILVVNADKGEQVDHRDSRLDVDAIVDSVSMSSQYMLRSIISELGVYPPSWLNE